MQTLKDIQHEAQVSQHLWVKVLGMLQQNWCLLEQNPSGSLDLVFFDDLGRVFDWISAPDLLAAQAVLRANRFKWMWESSSFYSAAGVPSLPEPGVRERSRPVYSSGEYWTELSMDKLQNEVPWQSPPTNCSSDNLYRFVEAQDPNWYTIVEELAAGHKQTHWMWFVFPQLRDLGSSRLAQYFGFSDPREAAKYWEDDVLGCRLRSCVDLLLGLPVETLAEKAFGKIDAMKLRSCMTLFEHVSGEDAGFGDVVDRYFQGERCPLTLEIIKNSAPVSPAHTQ